MHPSIGAGDLDRRTVDRSGLPDHGVSVRINRNIVGERARHNRSVSVEHPDPVDLEQTSTRHTNAIVPRHVEHLLRCLLAGLARRTDRPLGFGQPACPMLTRDEILLLAAFTGAAGPGLARLAGDRAAALAPLLHSLRPMLKNIS